MTDTSTLELADTERLPQGDLGLLDSDLAQQLLRSTIPARLAFVALDGTPRVVPTWFEWTGTAVVMVTYVAGPNVGIRHPAARIAALRANPDVALSIDTEGFPARSLTIRGRAVVDEVEGLAPEYVASARRYLGEEAPPTDGRGDGPARHGAGPDHRPPHLGRAPRLHHPTAQPARRRLNPQGEPMSTNITDDADPAAGRDGQTLQPRPPVLGARPISERRRRDRARAPATDGVAARRRRDRDPLPRHVRHGVRRRDHGRLTRRGSADHGRRPLRPGRNDQL